MPYFIDTLDFKGSGSAAPSTAPPSQDNMNFNGPYFYSTDFLGTEIEYTGNFTRNGFGLGPSLETPCGYGPTDLINHPGVCWVTTSSDGDASPMRFRGISPVTSNQHYTMYPGTPTTSFTYIFKTPPVASITGDSYTMTIGPCSVDDGAATVNHGWCARYSDTFNSGRWIFTEFFNTTAQFNSNSSVPFVANTWMRLNVLIDPTNNVTANMTVCGTTTTTGNLLYSGPSTQLNLGNPLIMDIMSISMIRNSSPVREAIGFVVDYMSMIVATTGRVW